MGIGAAEQQAHRQTTGARTHRGETPAAGSARRRDPGGRRQLPARGDPRPDPAHPVRAAGGDRAGRGAQRPDLARGLRSDPAPTGGAQADERDVADGQLPPGQGRVRRHHPTAAGAAGSGPVPRRAHRDPAGQWYHPARRVPGWAQSPALLVHQVSFYAWLAAVVVHVVPHFLQAVHLASRDWARRVGGARRAARGGSARCGRRGEPAAGRCSPPVHPTTCSTFPSHELQVRPATTARPAGPPAGRASRESSVDGQQAGSGIVEQCGC